MALPFTIVAVGLAWNLALRARDPNGASERGWLARVGISGALVGSLYALNAWDLPTFLLLVAIGVWTGAGATISRAWKPLLLLAVAAVAAWLPFLTTYVPPTSGAASELPVLIARLPVVSSLIAAVGLHRGERTSVIEYLTIFGVPYAFGIALVMLGAARDWDSSRPSRVQCKSDVAREAVSSRGTCTRALVRTPHQPTWTRNSSQAIGMTHYLGHALACNSCSKPRW